MTTANHLLGDRAALDKAWEEDGYWFFRDVLDKDAVGRLRQIYVDLLDDLGVARRDDPTIRYTGASLEHFPFRMDPLTARQPWKAFVAERPVHDFFTRLLDDEPFWVPTVEYRATPPAQDFQRPRFDFIHQDGYYNKGIAFRICWVPLAEIDADIGGLALAEGMHHRSMHEGTGEQTIGIPLDAVPQDRWRRATYRPGDVLLMHINTPHSGLSNLSDRFRLSIDMRVLGQSDHVPIVGRLTGISQSTVTVRDDRGETRLPVNEQTYCRGLDGQKIPHDRITDHFHVGQEVIVASEDGIATLLRPIH